MIDENLTTWAGKAVTDWDPDAGGVTDPAGTAYRLRVEWEAEESWLERFAAFLGDPRAAEVTGLVVGSWGEVGNGTGTQPIVEALASAADHLPGLTSLFIGDMTSEENEISWIRQSDLSSLFNAYPGLEHLGARGGNGLSLGIPRSPKLKMLVLESGGLPVSVVEEVQAADLPALEHLELWLGSSGYGGDATLSDFHVLLGEDAPEKWPNLRHLGLCDCEFSDEIARALVNAPLYRQLAVLDLSLGTLGDEGATALADSPLTARLEKLDFHHHYVSPDAVARLKGLGIEIDASDEQEADKYGGEEHRYVAVGE